MINGHISPCGVRALCGLYICDGVGGEGNSQMYHLSFSVIFAALCLAAVIEPSRVSKWGGRREQHKKSWWELHCWKPASRSLVLADVSAESFMGMPETADPVAGMAPGMPDALPLADSSPCSPGIQFIHDPHLLGQELEWL